MPRHVWRVATKASPSDPPAASVGSLAGEVGVRAVIVSKHRNFVAKLGKEASFGSCLQDGGTVSPVDELEQLL